VPFVSNLFKFGIVIKKVGYTMAQPDFPVDEITLFLLPTGTLVGTPPPLAALLSSVWLKFPDIRFPFRRPIGSGNFSI